MGDKDYIVCELHGVYNKHYGCYRCREEKRNESKQKETQQYVLINKIEENNRIIDNKIDILISASKSNRVNTVKRILESGLVNTDGNDRDNDSNPLYTAIEHKSNKVMKLLIDLGADVGKAINIAISRRNIELYFALIKQLKYEYDINTDENIEECSYDIEANNEYSISFWNSAGIDMKKSELLVSKRKKQISENKLLAIKEYIEGDNRRLEEIEEEKMAAEYLDKTRKKELFINKLKSTLLMIASGFLLVILMLFVDLISNALIKSGLGQTVILIILYYLISLGTSKLFSYQNDNFNNSIPVLFTDKYIYIVLPILTFILFHILSNYVFVLGKDWGINSEWMFGKYAFCTIFCSLYIASIVFNKCINMIIKIISILVTATLSVIYIYINSIIMFKYTYTLIAYVSLCFTIILSFTIISAILTNKYISIYDKYR